MEKSNYHSNADHHKRHMKQSVEKRLFYVRSLFRSQSARCFWGGDWLPYWRQHRYRPSLQLIQAAALT